MSGIAKSIKRSVKRCLGLECDKKKEKVEDDDKEQYNISKEYIYGMMERDAAAAAAPIMYRGQPLSRITGEVEGSPAHYVELSKHHMRMHKQREIAKKDAANIAWTVANPKEARVIAARNERREREVDARNAEKLKLTPRARSPLHNMTTPGDIGRAKAKAQRDAYARSLNLFGGKTKRRRSNKSKSNKGKKSHRRHH